VPPAGSDLMIPLRRFHQGDDLLATPLFLSSTRKSVQGLWKGHLSVDNRLKLSGIQAHRDLDQLLPVQTRR
jgi:hypothetical protein